MCRKDRTLLLVKKKHLCGVWALHVRFCTVVDSSLKHLLDAGNEEDIWVGTCYREDALKRNHRLGFIVTLNRCYCLHLIPTCLGNCRAASDTPWIKGCPWGWALPPPFIYWVALMGTMPRTDGWFRSTWKSEEIFLPFWMSNSDSVT